MTGPFSLAGHVNFRSTSLINVHQNAIPVIWWRLAELSGCGLDVGDRPASLALGHGHQPRSSRGAELAWPRCTESMSFRRQRGRGYEGAAPAAGG